MNHHVLFRSALIAIFITGLAVAATMPPFIYTATVNTAGTQITITGLNFSPFGGNPLVTLGSTTLVLVTYSNSQYPRQLAIRCVSAWYDL